MKFHTILFLVLFWLSSSRRLAAGFHRPLFHCHQQQIIVWSLGIIVFTLVTKQTFYPQSNVDFEYLTHSLHHIRQADIDHDIRR